MTELLVYGLVWGVSISFIAMALGLSWRILGMLDFGLVGVYAVAAYSLLTLRNLGLPIWLCIPLAVISGGVVQILLYKLLYSRFIRDRKPLASLVLLGLAALYLCENAIALGFTSAGQLVLTNVQQSFLVMDATLSVTDIASIATLSVVVCTLLLLLRFSSVGLSLRAVASNPDLAAVFGIEIERVRVTVFLLTGILTAIPAVITALYEPIIPSTGFNPILFGFAALVIASVKSGIGLVSHTAAGLALGVVTGLSLLAIPSQWQLAVPFFGMFLVSVVRKSRSVQRAV